MRILYIDIDSLRPDHLSCYGYLRQTSPNIDALADADADPARVEELAQGGIAPSPRILFPSPEPDCTGDECKPPPIFCVGVECSDPGFVNNPVRTLWTQDGIE